MKETKLKVQRVVHREKWRVILLESLKEEYNWEVKENLFEGTLLECEAYIRLEKEGLLI